jgi:hypothetical protein
VWRQLAGWLPDLQEDDDGGKINTKKWGIGQLQILWSMKNGGKRGRM